MTQEDKELLLQDLCARLSYGVKLKIGEHSDYKLIGIIITDESPIKVEVVENDIPYRVKVTLDIVKPCLRPMSTMTEEENNEWRGFIDNLIKSCDFKFPESEIYLALSHSDSIDWLNKNHFDYRGLIKKGLAIAVTEENNPY